VTEGHAPAGWPPEVRPPGSPDWERTAVAWLYDLCPADYRRYEVLRRHPVVLARFAAGHVAACRSAVRDAVATSRAELRDVVAPDVVEAALVALGREGDRLAAAARAVDLVEVALRGQRFVPRL
jgi:hypothetical protein